MGRMPQFAISVFQLITRTKRKHNQSNNKTLKATSLSSEIMPHYIFQIMCGLRIKAHPSFFALQPFVDVASVTSIFFVMTCIS